METLKQLHEHLGKLLEDGIDPNMKLLVCIDHDEEVFPINEVAVHPVLYEDPENNPLFDEKTMNWESEEACMGPECVFIFGTREQP